MIIDLILDRKDGKPYNPHDFYSAAGAYGPVAYDICTNMDEGDEEDVRDALKAYIVEGEYNHELVAYIDSVAWLTA